MSCHAHETCMLVRSRAERKQNTSRLLTTHTHSALTPTAFISALTCTYLHHLHAPLCCCKTSPRYRALRRSDPIGRNSKVHPPPWLLTQRRGRKPTLAGEIPHQSVISPLTFTNQNSATTHTHTVASRALYEHTTHTHAICLMMGDEREMQHPPLPPMMDVAST
mgnify:CR=1 FL=1